MEDISRRRQTLSVVLDSSVTLAWILSDEVTVNMTAVFDQVAEHGATVPTLWRLEVANALTVAMRRGRIDQQFRRSALSDLALLEIKVDEHTGSAAWEETLDLADKLRLTVYDAAYVELAQRVALPLATLDGEMRAAASKLGLPIL
jgi:predicted nucleic acid-binding protein